MPSTLEEFDSINLTKAFSLYEYGNEEVKRRDEELGPFQWFPVPEDLPKLEETTWYLGNPEQG